MKTLCVTTKPTAACVPHSDPEEHADGQASASLSSEEALLSRSRLTVGKMFTGLGSTAMEMITIGNNRDQVSR